MATLVKSYAAQSFYNSNLTQCLKANSLSLKVASKPVISASEFKVKVRNMSIPQEELDFEHWVTFDGQFSGVNSRKLILSFLQRILNHMSSNPTKKFYKHKKLVQSIKNLKNPQIFQHKRIRSKNQIVLKNKRKELSLLNDEIKEMLVADYFQIMFPIKSIKNEAHTKYFHPKVTESAIRVKHLSSLFEKVFELIERMEKNPSDDVCLICQYNLNYKIAVKFNCCGMDLHYSCVKEMLDSNSDIKGAKLSYSNFGLCMVCHKDMKCENATVSKMIEPFLDLRNKMVACYKARIKFDDDKSFDLDEKTSDYAVLEYALKKYRYFGCFACKEAYFAGLNSCHEGNESIVEKEKMLCHKCDKVKGYERNCKKHGKTYIQWKCMFCCSIATWECGDTHFCELCHKKAGPLWSLQRKQPRNSHLLQCPCISSKKTWMPEKIDLDTCPLGISHPPHGEDYCLGCAECQRIQKLKEAEENDNQ